MKDIVTIDGPAGAGKSTISRLLARKFHLLYLDTGAMYRAVALEAHRKGINFEDSESLRALCDGLDLHFRFEGTDPRLYNGKEDISRAIRSPEMDMLSSGVSMIREVREAMTGLQQRIGREGGLVAEGRDMGTVVFPDAEHKFFITASTEIRAERRYKERIDRGERISQKEVETDLRKRDAQDSTRSIAPLRPAEDAHIIDTTALSPAQVLEEIRIKIQEKYGNKRSLP